MMKFFIGISLINNEPGGSKKPKNLPKIKYEKITNFEKLRKKLLFYKWLIIVESS